MAKQDQRILKFLTQNADRAPTITDMMTRLNMSISDISTALNSLTAQGLVSKRTNAQGIECWFPANGTPPMAAVESAQESRSADALRSAGEPRIMPGLNNPAPPEPSPLPPLQPTLSSLSSSTAYPASLTATSPGPSHRSPSRESAAYPPSASASASPAFPASPSPASPGAGMPDRRNAEFAGYVPSPSPAAAVPSAPAPALTASIPPVQDSLPGVPPPAPYPLAPVKNGIGFLTFAVGLILSAAAAVYFSGRLLKRDFEVAARNFVEKRVLDQAVATQSKFEASTKAHVTALEADVKGLKEQLALMQAANDSLKVAADKAEAAAKAAAPVAKKGRTRRR